MYPGVTGSNHNEGWRRSGDGGDKGMGGWGDGGMGRWGDGKPLRWAGSPTCSKWRNPKGGTRRWGERVMSYELKIYSSLLTNAQSPIPNPQCPMPNAQCPMPNSIPLTY